MSPDIMVTYDPGLRTILIEIGSEEIALTAASARRLRDDVDDAIEQADDHDWIPQPARLREQEQADADLGHAARNLENLKLSKAEGVIDEEEFARRERELSEEAECDV